MSLHIPFFGWYLLHRHSHGPVDSSIYFPAAAAAVAATAATAAVAAVASTAAAAAVASTAAAVASTAAAAACYRSTVGGGESEEMASLFSYQILLHPLPHARFSPPSSAPSFLPNRNQAHFFPRTHSPSCRFRESAVARLGMGAQLSDFESAGDLTRELLGHFEGVIYAVVDAAISSSSSLAAAEQVSKQSSDWLSGITNSLEAILKILKDGLSALHVPYAYGFAIIILTFLVKVATFPLTKKQVESAMAMKSLQPQVKAIQQLYAGDQERIQIETARLYKLAGRNPLAGCLPTLATIPVWIGLYRALSNVANEGLLNEGFFWIPSLSGPTTIAARQSGSGTSWLFPFVDGHPPLGWSDTTAYLVLPVLLVVSQYISAQIMQPPQDTDPSQKSSQAVLKLLPLMIGYFALSVPSGLSLYWLTNNLLSTAQQLWLQKLGGTRNPVEQFGDEISMEETSNILKSLSAMQRSTTVETEKTKSGVGLKVDSSTPHRGERFKQIKEEEARRRKQREEGSCRAEEEEIRRIEASADGESRMYTEKQASESEFEEKVDDKKSDNFEKNQHLSMKTNGGLNYGSTVVKQGENSQQGVEMESQELHAASGYQTSAADSIDNRDQNIQKDEV